MNSENTEHDSTIIAVVDDDQEIRKSMSLILHSQGYRVECFESGETFLSAYVPEKFSCIILDICLPEMDGMCVFNELRQQRYFPPVIFFSGYGNISTAVSALKLGASNYIEKPIIDTTLVAKIEESIRMGNDVFRQWKSIEKLEALLSSLTEREKEILTLVLKGKMNKHISCDLGISIKTVETHRANIFQKMDVKSTIELANKFMEFA